MFLLLMIDPAPLPDEEAEIQRFAVLIEKVIEKKTGAIHVSMKTQGTGIPMSEAAIILEGWANKVKSEMQKPFIENMMFGVKDQAKEPGKDES